MDKIIDFLKSDSGTLILFFSALILVFIVYYFVSRNRKNPEKMPSEERNLKLPQKKEEHAEVVTESKEETPIEQSEASEPEEEQVDTLPQPEQEVVEDVAGEEVTSEVTPSEEATADDQYAAIRYSYSYFAHLTLAPEQSQKRYNEIKQLIMTYEGITASITFKEERFIYLGKTVIKFRLIGNVLRIYLALSSEDMATINIKSQDLSAMKEHKRTPFLIRISGNTGVKRAKEAIELLMDRHGIKKDENASLNDYIPPVQSVEELIAQDYIRRK